MKNDQECTTSCDGYPIQLNIEILEKVMKLIEKYDKEDPIKKFIFDNGFDPNEGDLLVMPLGYKSKWWTNHPNLIFSPFVNKIFIIKRPAFTMDKFDHSFCMDKRIPAYLSGLGESCT